MSFDPENYRKDFPILGRVIHGDRPLVYLDNAASTQRPRQVIESIVDTYENHYANVHRGIYKLAVEIDALYKGAREKVRAFINAPALVRDTSETSFTTEQIIFTSGATQAINLVARSWGDRHVSRGDEILLTEMEHHSNLIPWYQLAERKGAQVRHLPLRENGTLDLEKLVDLLTKRTKIVAVAAISNVLGTINPIETIIHRAHEVGAVVLIDGAQSVPHLPIDVQALDLDFLAFSGHKMLGPSGIGVLYGKMAVLDEMPPFLGGGSMIKEVTLDGFTSANSPAKFEAGTPPIAPAIGLGIAADYLNRIGLDKIRRHERLLTKRAHEVLSAVKGLRILGPEPEEKGGIVSFVFESGRPHPHDIAHKLDQSGIAIRAGHHCAMPLHKRYGLSATARASFYLYNTLEEVEKLGEALEQLKDVFRPRKKVAR